MASLPKPLAQALAGVHDIGLYTDPNSDPNSAGGGGGSSQATPDPAAAQQQDPNASQDPNADPNAQQADPLHQALWQLFPSTDPSWLQGLVSQGGDPQQALEQAFQQVESDRSQFDQIQDAMMAHLAVMFAAPQDAGQDTGAPPPQDPGVGGAGAGY